MAQLTYHATLHKEYHGNDGARAISARDGETITVSDETARRLLKDFPGNWKLIGKLADKALEAAPENKLQKKSRNKSA